MMHGVSIARGMRTFVMASAALVAIALNACKKLPETGAPDTGASPSGWLEIAQVPPHGCAVFVNDRAWPAGASRAAFAPGDYEVTCRSDGSVLFSRKVHVVDGGVTPIYWGP